MKGVMLHGILALTGLTLAYLVWTDDGTVRSVADGVTVVACAADRITEIVYESEENDIRLERRGEGSDHYWWVVATRKPENGDETVQQFVGGQRVDEYLERLAPFVAQRSLGEANEERIAAFALDEEHAGTLRFACGERTHAFRIGGSVHGSNDRYVQKAEGGEVYLVEARTIGDLQSSSLLMQRPMHRFENTEIETIDVSSAGGQRRLRQRNRLEQRAAEWVDDSDPDRRNELFGNWLNLVGQLTANEYLPPGGEPGSDLEGSGLNVVPVVRLEYRGADGASIGNLELVRVDGGTEPSYYARSEATRSWVKVRTGSARPVEQDVRPVLGLEPLEEPAPPDGEEPTESTESQQSGSPTSPSGGTQEESQEASGAAPSESARTETPPPPPAPAPNPHAGHGH